MNITSCAFGNRLHSVGADSAAVTGTFTLILYGCTHSDDLETLAVLDGEGDLYTFEPYAPEFNYRVKQGVPAEEALAEAEHFIMCHNSFQRPRLSRLVDLNGNTAGYELRPLYLPLTFGVADVLDSDYSIKDNKVTITIRLIPSVERILPHGGSDTGGFVK